MSALSVCRQLLARGSSQALSRTSRPIVSLSAKPFLVNSRTVVCGPLSGTRLSQTCSRSCRCDRCNANHVISQYVRALQTQIRLMSTEAKKPEPTSEPAVAQTKPADAPAAPAPETKSDQPATAAPEPEAKGESAPITSKPAPQLGDKGPRGPTTLLHLAIITVLLGLGVYQYNTIKEQKLTTVRTEQKVVGAPKLGGPFQLTESTKGSPVTEKDFLGEYILIYFGFTHCPDICPSELKKMDEALQLVDKAQDVHDAGISVKPIFITVDPKRDSLEKLEAYKKELPLHPRTICLTGTDEQLAKIAKAYRMYYSKPPADAKDYMVDHSIFFFLVGPDGKFMEFYGKNLNAQEVASKMRVALMNDKGRRAEAGQWPPNKAEILAQYERQVGAAPQK